MRIYEPVLLSTRSTGLIKTVRQMKFNELVPSLWASGISARCLIESENENEKKRATA
jgi:hypothetical protein